MYVITRSLYRIFFVSGDSMAFYVKNFFFFLCMPQQCQYYYHAIIIIQCMIKTHVWLHNLSHDYPFSNYAIQHDIVMFLIVQI